jgi:hypothetical protein
MRWQATPEEVLGMCHDWWMRRRVGETEETRRLWDEFERTPPVSEPEMTADDRDVTLERDSATPTPAER